MHDQPETEQQAHERGLDSVQLTCHPRMTALVLMSADLVALILCNAVAIYGYLFIRGRYHPGLYGSLWPCLLLFIIAYDLLGLYHGVALYPGAGLGPAEELRRGTIATTACYLLLASGTFLAKTSAHYSRAVFLIAWMLSLVALPTLRAFLRLTLARRPWWGVSCLVFGIGPTAQRTLRILHRHPEYGLKPVAAVAQHTDQAQNVGSIPVLREEDAAESLATRGVSYAIAALSDINRNTLIRFVEGPGSHFQHILVVPPDFGHSGIWASARCIETVLGLEIRQNLLFPLPRFIRRTLDIVAVLATLPFTLPAIAVLALLVKLTSRGPAFYAHQRIGRGGKSFSMWKFRTMRVDSEAFLEHYLQENPEARDEWLQTRKLRYDPRVTTVGRWLRRLSLDELPQVWNVLRGHMSLVGPRPIVTEEIASYGDIYHLYTRVRPGLTGLWQVSGRNALPFDDRVALDAFYVRNWSVWLDLYVLLRTIPAVISGDGAY